jgi:hypothetical protein
MAIFRLALAFTAALGSILVYPRGIRAAVSARYYPQDIEAVGENANNWNSYGDWDLFLACNEKLRLFKLPDSDFNTHYENSTRLHQQRESTATVRACTSVRGHFLSALRIPWDQALANFADRRLVNVHVSWSGSGPRPAEHAVPG